MAQSTTSSLFELAHAVRKELRQEGARCSVYTTKEGERTFKANFGSALVIFSDRWVTLKHRTGVDGWAPVKQSMNAINTSFLKPVEKVAQALQVAKNLNKGMTINITSKKFLPPPEQFSSDEIVAEGPGFVISQWQLASCKVRDVVSIANNLKIVSAAKPGNDAWFLVEVRTRTGGSDLLITNDDGYYWTNKPGRRVIPTQGWGPQLTLTDRTLLRAAISSYTQEVGS